MGLNVLEIVSGLRHCVSPPAETAAAPDSTGEIAAEAWTK
jgi:hypothetical protein